MKFKLYKDKKAATDCKYLFCFVQVASSALGIGPHMAMQLAERLYTQGYIRSSLLVLF